MRMVEMKEDGDVSELPGRVGRSECMVSGMGFGERVVCCT